MIGRMIERDITPCLTGLFEQYPFVTVTGPRQSGKTTLCRATFPHLKYVNLEAPDVREFARSDPRGFLSQIDDGAILDEIQRVPELLSYLQVLADERGRNGLFILTGSEHFKLSEAVSQSLAGRTGLLRLLPFSLDERQRTGAGNDADEILYSGFYPRIYDQGLDPRQAFADYFETYVERDVRRLGEIRNLSSFQRFVRLCAGRIGQLTNLVALGSDAGVSHTTARHWLDVLEASFIAFRLQPFHANVRKRLVKSPKLYFYDVGLASYLVGIERAQQIVTHPLRGALFENMVVVEALKYRYNLGRSSNLSFFRDSRGLECDLLFETASGVGAIEIKSGATIATDSFDSLNTIAKSIPEISTKIVVYGGSERQSRSAGEVVPFHNVYDVLERFEVSEEIAAFVQDNMVRVPSPSETDIEILDNVYSKYIRPTLEEVERSLEQHKVALLFHSVESSSYLNSGFGYNSSRKLLKAGIWEETKNRYILKRGFELSAGRPLVLGHNFTFTGPINTGDLDHSCEITLVWFLDNESVSRRVDIAGAPVQKLSDRIPYSELSTRSAKVDSICSGILKAIKNEIEKHSKPGQTTS